MKQCTDMAEPFFKIHSAHTTALWHQSPLYSYATFISFRTKVILGFLINTSHTCALNAQKKQTKKTIAFLITRNASTHCQVGKKLQSHKDTANRTEERQVRFVPHRVKNGIFCFVASIMNKTLIFFSSFNSCYCAQSKSMHRETSIKYLPNSCHAQEGKTTRTLI